MPPSPALSARKSLPAAVRLAISGLVLIGFLLRLRGLFLPDLGPDEALFGTWARWIASGWDVLLANQLVDKPPLAFYLGALSLMASGGAEAWALRLPALLASTLALPLLGRIVWRLYADWLAALLAVAVLAFSPLASRFGHVGILDPLWICLALASLAVMSGDREGRSAGIAGLWAGLALLAKYQALLYLPIFGLLGYLFGWRRASWRRWLAGFLPSLGLLFLWSLARPGPDIFTLQWANYGGLRLIRSWELWPRLAEWGAAWSPALAMPVVLLALAMPLFLAWLIQGEDEPTALDQLFVIFVLAFFILHWFVATPLWERYVLAGLPILAIVVARLTSRLWLSLPPLVAPRFPARRYAPALLLALISVQAPVALNSWARDAAPPGAAAGMHEVAAYLADAPYGTVLYDHWHSWEWRYAFFGRGVYVAWFAGPADLVADLDVFTRRSGARYLVLPPGPEAAPVRRAVKAGGYGLEPILHTVDSAGASGLTLYRVFAP